MRRCAAALLIALCAIVLQGCVLQWSPDGQQLAFLWGDQAHDDGSVAVIRADGSDLRVLPHTDGVAAAQWSPDGTALFLSIIEPAGTHDWAEGAITAGADAALILYDVKTHLTHPLDSRFGLPFVWRKDGRESVRIGMGGEHPRSPVDRTKPGGLRLAAMHDDDRPEAAWTAADGKTVRTTAVPFSSIRCGFYLPDSEEVAVLAPDARSSESLADHVAMDVYLVREGRVRRLTDSGDVIGLTLSADGRKLIWARAGSPLAEMQLGLFRYDLTSGQTVRLSFPDRLAVLNNDPIHPARTIVAATFSPDASRVALVADRGAYWACYAVRIDGTDARLVRITHLPAIKSSQLTLPGAPIIAAFSPDGRRLAVLTYDSARTGKNPVVNLATTKTNGTDLKVLCSAEVPTALH